MIRCAALLAWISLVVLTSALQGCGDDRFDRDAGGEGAANGACDVCAMADLCCVAHTANPESNCQLLSTCTMFTGAERVSVIDGCAYYLRAASTPPAPAACGPHPDAD